MLPDFTIAITSVADMVTCWRVSSIDSKPGPTTNDGAMLIAVPELARGRAGIPAVQASGVFSSVSAIQIVATP